MIEVEGRTVEKGGAIQQMDLEKQFAMRENEIVFLPHSTQKINSRWTDLTVRS